MEFYLFFTWLLCIVWLFVDSILFDKYELDYHLKLGRDNQASLQSVRYCPWSGFYMFFYVWRDKK